MRSLVEDVMEVSGDAGDCWLDVLDLGCGRGGAGHEFRGLANRLTGIDLSKLAIEQATQVTASPKSTSQWKADVASAPAQSLARSPAAPPPPPTSPQPGLYDELKHGDLLVALQTSLPESMDLMVACDSIPYFGDLSEIMRHLHSILRSGGVAALTLDELVSSDANVEYELGFTGRWSHAPSYVEALAQRNGLTVERKQLVPGKTHFARPAPTQIYRRDDPLTHKSVVYVLQKQ